MPIDRLTWVLCVQNIILDHNAGESEAMALELLNSDPPQTILVIGGGLGGLAFAQILRHSPASHKYKVLVFERDASASAREQGYQIGINNSGASCLSSIPHVSELLATTKHKPNSFALVDTNLSVMMSMKQGPPGSNLQGVAGLINRRKVTLPSVGDTVVLSFTSP